MFNPVSLLRAFDGLDFQNYWYETGNPEMLMKHIHTAYYDFRRFENDVEYPKDDLKTFKNDEHNMDLVPLLYYTGYLTIKSYDRKTRTYVLGFPNNEIKLSFLQGLINEFYREPDSMTGFIYADFLRDFRNGDVESGRFQA